MKRIIIYSLLVIALFLTSCSSSKKVTSNVKQYDVETMGVGNDGTYLIRVTDYFRTTDEMVYLDGLKKDAVHCVIYQGIPAGNGSIKQPALMTSDTKVEGNEQALNNFFEQKLYLNYINSVVNSSKKITKMKDSKDYKISVVISVNKDDLRKYLIDNNIIKPLDFLF
ncbi:MAG: hypothetical protein IJZ87_08495 [Bacteroidales bacterium]|nr:hypothetical protein [Bacteroidales bacterium]